MLYSLPKTTTTILFPQVWLFFTHQSLCLYQFSLSIFQSLSVGNDCFVFWTILKLLYHSIHCCKVSHTFFWWLVVWFLNTCTYIWIGNFAFCTSFGENFCSKRYIVLMIRLFSYYTCQSDNVFFQTSDLFNAYPIYFFHTGNFNWELLFVRKISIFLVWRPEQTTLLLQFYCTHISMICQHL